MFAGDLIATGMVGLFFALFLLALIWAVRSGQFKDVEQAKFKMFEAEDEPSRDND
jgi:cbb3-type cytochrome oxidase maturation protein